MTIKIEWRNEDEVLECSCDDDVCVELDVPHDDYVALQKTYDNLAKITLLQKLREMASDLELDIKGQK